MTVRWGCKEVFRCVDLPFATPLRYSNHGRTSPLPCLVYALELANPAAQVQLRIALLQRQEVLARCKHSILTLQHRASALEANVAAVCASLCA
jgi:hypothetical protein